MEELEIAPMDIMTEITKDTVQRVTLSEEENKYENDKEEIKRKMKEKKVKTNMMMIVAMIGMMMRHSILAGKG